MKLTDIIKSHQYHLYEKYYSFLSELLNLKNMIYLYKERVQMNDDILEEIMELSSRIKLFYASTKQLTNHDKFISFIISLDKRKVELEEVARHIKLIHEYILQNITEKFSYLNTFPPLQKRYSSKALTEILNSHHEALYKAIASSSDKKLIYSVWSHSDNYRLKSFSNKSYFTQHSFYYHDIVWNIPTIIDHEVILAALQNNDECDTWVDKVSKKIVEKYSTSMKKKNKYFGNDNLSFAERTYYKEFDDFLRGNIEPILWELLADFVGYRFYGEAYIKSFLHETLGEFFGREFFDLYGRRHDSISVSVNINRDSLLLRQLVLLAKKYALVDRDIDTYENDMFFGLSDIIGLGEKDINKSSLVQLIKGSVNEDDKHVDDDRKKELKDHVDSARLYSVNMKIIYSFLLEHTSEKPDIDIDIKTPFIKDGQNSIASKLWEKRDSLLKRGKIPHRSILRQELLGEEYKPCILYRSHTVRSSNNTGSDELAFGQFDRIYIEDIEDTEIDILDKIDGLINSFSKNSDKFDTKHALLRVVKSEDNIPNRKIRLYMMLYLKDGNMEVSMDLLRKIEDTIKIANVKNPKYALYKSYGPEDIVIEIDFDDEEIWKFIELIRSEFKDDIKETFSSIVMLDYKELKLNNNIWIKGYYRLLPDVKFQDLYKQAENIERYKKLLKTNSMRILDITNKYYDFEIWWNTKDIEQIIAYEKVLGNELLDSTYFIVSSNNSLKYGKATKTKSRKGIS